MIIGINCQHLLHTPAGPTYHLIELIKAIAKIDKKGTYRLYFQEQPKTSFMHMLIGENKNFEIVVINKDTAWTQYYLLKEIRKNKVNMLFTSIHTYPILLPRKIKLISMIHGFEFKVNNQYKNKPLLNLIHPYLLKLVIYRSNRIIVPSESTRNAVSMFTNERYNNKVLIISEGVNSQFTRSSEEEVLRVKQKYGIKDKYIFFISTIQPRKNIPRMVAGFKKALSLNNKFRDYELIIAGKLGWEYEESLNMPKKLGIEEQVKFIGHIEASERPFLLTGAEFFISCSLEEGFGLTLLEALACKTPSLVSNIEAYRELGLAFVRYVDPFSIESISSGIVNMIDDPIPETILDNASRHSNNYTWESTAKKTIKVFEDLKN